MRRILTLAAFAFTTLTAHAAADPALDKVLRQLDAASAKFKSAEADVKSDFYQRVVKETETELGTVYFLHQGTGTEMGLMITSPGKKFVHFQNGQGDLYDSATKQTTHFGNSQQKARAESFLTLGFGGSGKDLERAWEIKLLGTESLSDGGTTVTADKLDLVAKDPDVRNLFSHIIIWIDPERGISLKQESSTPEGDKRTATYTHIRYNLKVDTKKYALPKR